MEWRVCEEFKGESRHFWRQCVEVTRQGFWRTLEDHSMDKVSNGHLRTLKRRRFPDSKRNFHNTASFFCFNSRMPMTESGIPHYFPFFLKSFLSSFVLWIILLLKIIPLT